MAFALWVAIEGQRSLHDDTAISFERARISAVGVLVRLATDGLGERALTDVLHAAGASVEQVFSPLSPECFRLHARFRVS